MPKSGAKVLELRPMISGVLAGIAIIGAIILGMMNQNADMQHQLLAAAGVFGAYAVGLQSEVRK